MEIELEYTKKDRLAVEGQTINVTAGSLQGDWLNERDNPSEA